MAVATVLATVLLAGCPSKKGFDLKSKLPEGFEVRLENVVYHRYDERGLHTEANTAYALLSPTSGEATFDRAEVQLRSEEALGNRVQVVAGSGVSNLYTGKLILRDGVRVVDATGRTLDAPSAAYSPETGTIAGPGPATLTGPNYLLRAETGFVIEIDEAVIDLVGPVTGYADELPGAMPGEGGPTPEGTRP